MHSHAHGNKKPSAVEKTSLEELVVQYGIVEKPNLKIPPPRRAPIKGLFIHQNGYRCLAEGCRYACIEQSTIQDHWYKKHSTILHLVPMEERYKHPVSLQSYYSNKHNTYWEVDPLLDESTASDLYTAFVNLFIPVLDADRPVQPPGRDRDITPWLRVSGFHKLLGDYVTDTEKRKYLVDLVSRPKSKDVLFGKVHDWVFEYVDGIRKMAHEKVQYTFLRRMLSGSGEYVSKQISA
jgi:hypothetical protein